MNIPPFRTTSASNQLARTGRVEQADRLAAKQRQRSLADIFDGKTILAKHHLFRCRNPVAIDRDNDSVHPHIAAPALRNARLDGQSALDARWQYTLAIFGRLFLKELPT